MKFGAITNVLRRIILKFTNEIDMEQYEVMKEDAILGPFTIDEIAEFVHSGLILKRDYAYSLENPDEFRTVIFFLKKHDKKVSIEHRGNIFSQIKEIGHELILPATIFTKEPWKKDRQLFILSLVGLTLSCLISIAPLLNAYILFYCIAFYFSTIWGMFFYYLFRTEQVKLKTTVLLFFCTQILTTIVFFVLDLGAINPFEGLYSTENWLVSLIACILGIGVVEEFIKVLPVFLILYLSRGIVKSQTAVFYGLMSGIAFGVYEGVNYQLGPNYQLLLENGISEGYVYSYISNIARLTSLPFLHAIWCGIGSYFVAFAFLYPRFRVSLYTLAILIPATIHGLYDFLCFNVPFMLSTIPVVIIGVVLLMVYLNIRYDFHSKLAD